MDYRRARPRGTSECAWVKSRFFSLGFLAYRFLGFGSWWVPGFSGRAPEAPETPRGGPRGPRSLGYKILKCFTFLGMKYGRILDFSFGALEPVSRAKFRSFIQRFSSRGRW